MNKVEEIKRKLFAIFDYIRGSLGLEDHPFILYLIVLYHKNIISPTDLKFNGNNFGHTILL